MQTDYKLDIFVYYNWRKKCVNWIYTHNIYTYVHVYDMLFLNLTISWMFVKYNITSSSITAASNNVSSQQTSVSETKWSRIKSHLSFQQTVLMQHRNIWFGRQKWWTRKIEKVKGKKKIISHFRRGKDARKIVVFKEDIISFDCKTVHGR